MGEQSKKLGVMMLAALVVSAMVGGGIFSLPQNMSQGAGAGAVLIAWIITGVGIFFLANTFRILADARPDATTGIYDNMINEFDAAWFDRKPAPFTTEGTRENGWKRLPDKVAFPDTPEHTWLDRSYKISPR